MGRSIFPHKRIHKGTWRSPDGQTVNQIAHICISRRWASSLRDVRVYRSADIGSNHYVIVADTKVKLKSRCMTKKTAGTYYTRKLLNEQLFLQVITLNYQIGSQHYKIQTTRKQNTWINFQEAVTGAAQTILERCIGMKKERWITDSTWTAIDERKALKKLKDRKNLREEA